MKVRRLSPSAIIPTRATAGSAGYDLSAASETKIAPRGKAIIPTDLAIALPRGCYGRVAPRSGLTWNTHTDVAAGVIDRDYRGAIGIVIFNHSDAEVVITRGMKCAQLIIEVCLTPEVEEVSELPETMRGAGGFGSTGTGVEERKAETLAVSGEV